MVFQLMRYYYLLLMGIQVVFGLWRLQTLMNSCACIFGRWSPQFTFLKEEGITGPKVVYVSIFDTSRSIEMLYLFIVLVTLYDGTHFPLIVTIFCLNFMPLITSYTEYFFIFVCQLHLIVCYMFNPLPVLQFVAEFFLLLLLWRQLFYLSYVTVIFPLFCLSTLYLSYI